MDVLEKSTSGIKLQAGLHVFHGMPFLLAKMTYIKTDYLDFCIWLTFSRKWMK